MDVPAPFVLWQATSELPPITPEIVVVFAVAAVALLLFVTEWFPPDVTAIIVMFVLIVLGPWTQISTEEGISGFSNDATITVLAMLILSSGITRTGAVQRLGERLSAFAGADERRQLLATLAVAGVPSGFINNTPIVTMLMPVISDLAEQGNTSPSKLLIPLSYASMVGGMLTLVGTSTNLVASQVSARLLGHPFSMFEFTQLGVLVFVTGTLYLVAVGTRLIPERVKPNEDFVEEYELEGYLTEVVVDADSPMIGRTIEEAIGESPFDFDVLRLIRDGDTVVEPGSKLEIRAGDLLVVRVGLDTLRRLIVTEGLSVAPAATVTEEELSRDGEERTIAELVVPSWSALVDQTLSTAAFHDRYDATVLALRRGGDILRERMERTPLESGDTLLVQATSDTLNRLATNRDFIVVQEVSDPDYRTSKAPLAVAIVLAVVAVAAIGATDILVAALGGVVAMILVGITKPHEIYDAVEWNVIFLIAGLIPLGIAFEQTGAAALLGAVVAMSADFLPAIGVLWVFYVMTTLVTALVSNSASVILMLPIAIETANRVGSEPFSFVLAVTFAASADFMTPIGYQTNLLVYGPGGYKFTDYFRIGAPLQVILSVVTVLGIAFFWGV
ncbi:SLC13 family permease [Halegenticoccus soli]|uniref:SLC13 family permease n=1 Tax=Halegenticoccus soli TaxID=1985678 RepID=UPI0037442AB8